MIKTPIGKLQIDFDPLTVAKESGFELPLSKAYI